MLLLTALFLPAHAAPPADAFIDRGLRAEVLALGLQAHAAAKARGETDSDLLTVIDYSLSSERERLWVIDLASGELLFQEHVSHGRNTGLARATAFSNVEGSKQSSLGLMRTAETYTGKHGYSLKLDGLEPGFNDLARDRAIVIHPADYVDEAFIAEHGRAGRSWGCPALDPDVSAEIIDAIAGGSLVFGYAPDAEWLAGSRYLSD